MNKRGNFRTNKVIRLLYYLPMEMKVKNLNQTLMEENARLEEENKKLREEIEEIKNDLEHRDSFFSIMRDVLANDNNDDYDIATILYNVVHSEC
jgi:regulator of replication initiation timing